MTASHAPHTTILAFLSAVAVQAPCLAQSATGPSPYARAAPTLGRSFAPCRGPLSSVAVLGWDGGVLGEEKPDVEDTAVPDTLETQRAYARGRKPSPTRGARIAWTYLKAYSSKEGDLYARCRAAAGGTATVPLPVGTVACDFVAGSLTCR